MKSLTHSKVYRAGITAEVLKHETNDCSFHANKSERALEFHFNLASKGGGVTSVLLRIGKDDLPAILEAVANAMPDYDLFTECADVSFNVEHGSNP